MFSKDTNKNLWVAVIAGGQGTRLFPLSHDGCPKQFCSLDDKNTFIQATVRRFLNLGIKPTHVVVLTTNDNQTALAKKQTASLGVLSQDIYKIDHHYGYAGAMVKATEIIHHLDKDAIIISTPSDQYIVSDENFERTVESAVESAKNGSPTIIGVKITDLVTMTGCGHALYDSTDISDIKDVTGFIEKPDKEEANKLMRDDCSACNTGINVWKSQTLTDIISSKNIDDEGLNTAELMNKFTHLKVAVGTFQWFDCGTLKSLYDISKQTPTHHNATLGKGKVVRKKCRNSLFYAIEGIELRCTRIIDTAVLATSIDGQIIVTVVKLNESQSVKKLAEKYVDNKELLTEDFSFKSKNNVIFPSDFSDEIKIGFVGAEGYYVYSQKNEDDTILIAVAHK